MEIVKVFTERDFIPSSISVPEMEWISAKELTDDTPIEEMLAVMDNLPVTWHTLYPVSSRDGLEGVKFVTYR